MQIEVHLNNVVYGQCTFSAVSNGINRKLFFVVRKKGGGPKSFIQVSNLPIEKVLSKMLPKFSVDKQK